jgi:hypothetical protein
MEEPGRVSVLEQLLQERDSRRARPTPRTTARASSGKARRAKKR